MAPRSQITTARFLEALIEISTLDDAEMAHHINAANISQSDAWVLCGAVYHLATLLERKHAYPAFAPPRVVKK